MITYFQQSFAMRNADFSDVRRINNQLTAIGYNRLELMHAFPTGPKLVIHLRGASQDCLEGTFLISDVQLTR